MIPDETAICQRLFSEETYGRFSKWKGLPVLWYNAWWNWNLPKKVLNWRNML
jgi:hypothetical protein